MDINYCNFVNTIPQFGGTCWFNSILMACLYSHNSRNLLLKLAKRWDKSNNFLMIIKNILKNHYFNSTKTNKYFKKVKPEAILFKMLKSNKDIFLKNFLKYKIKNLGYSNLGWYNEYIIKFFKFLGVSCLDITYFKDKKTYLINFDKYFKFKQVSKNSAEVVNEKFNRETASLKKFSEEYKEVKKILDKVPDVLIVNHSELNSVYTKSVENLYSSYKKYNKEAVKAHYLETYKIKQDSSIKNYEKIINFNGHKYILDSCLISNYDEESNVGHSIVGLTCRDSHYVYNGWNTNTIDAAMNNEKTANEMKVCSLMPFEWDLKTNTEFCLNKSLCSLDFLKKNDKSRNLCFSFNKGNRILVYVRIEEDNKIIEETGSGSFISSKYISDMSDIIEDMYDIKKLKREELINYLKVYNVVDIDDMTTDKLRNLLIEKIKRKEFKIKKKVVEDEPIQQPKQPKQEPKQEPQKQPKQLEKEQPKITKKYLIEQIKIKQPDRKGLIAKTKDELLKILNESTVIIKKNKDEVKKTKKDLIEEIKIKYPNLKNLAKKTKEELFSILL